MEGGRKWEELGRAYHNNEAGAGPRSHQLSKRAKLGAGRRRIKTNQNKTTGKRDIRYPSSPWTTFSAGLILQSPDLIMDLASVSYTVQTVWDSIGYSSCRTAV